MFKGEGFFVSPEVTVVEILPSSWDPNGKDCGGRREDVGGVGDRGGGHDDIRTC